MTVSKRDHLSCPSWTSSYRQTPAHIQALGLFSRALVEVEFEIKRSRTERIESLEVVPATVEVVVVMPPTLLTLWIHGVLALVKLTPHLCNQTEERDEVKLSQNLNQTNKVKLLA